MVNYPCQYDSFLLACWNLAITVICSSVETLLRPHGKSPLFGDPGIQPCRDQTYRDRKHKIHQGGYSCFHPLIPRPVCFSTEDIVSYKGLLSNTYTTDSRMAPHH